MIEQLVDRIRGIRYGRYWADGRFTNDNPNFFNLPLLEQVLHLARSHACPIPYEVIQAYKKGWEAQHPDQPIDREAGMKMTRARYGECNFMYSHILNQAKEKNKKLYRELKRPKLRRINEPDGDHPKTETPFMHRFFAHTLSTPIGYALPRVVIEAMGRNREDHGDMDIRTPERMLMVLDEVDRLVESSSSPQELLLRLSEYAVRDQNARPEDVLTHVLAPGILKEENRRAEFQSIVNDMPIVAPTLFAAYKQMDAPTRSRFDIANIQVTIPVTVKR